MAIKYLIIILLALSLSGCAYVLPIPNLAAGAVLSVLEQAEEPQRAEQLP